MNREWLWENAGYPIKYNLTKNESYIEQMLNNDEVKLWLNKLTDRVLCGDLSNIHGSHDYRYENIVGKCFILGLDAKIPTLDTAMRFFVNFLNGHITKTYDDNLTFWKMYQYRDYETVLSCYLPFLGYAEEKSVQYVANKRLDIVYEFVKQGRYDVYRTDLTYPGANKAWKPYILDPDLYKDGNISLPSIHDMILFSGMYTYYGQEMKKKINAVIKWIFNDQYSLLNNNLYYYAQDDPSYKSKGINNKVILCDVEKANFSPREAAALLFQCFIFSRFEEAQSSRWFSKALDYLNGYKTETGRYLFPKEMLTEQKDSYVWNGGHMNAGESKKNKKYREILSTYWMERIVENIGGDQR